MTQITSKNHGHPSARQIMDTISPSIRCTEIRTVYAKEIGEEEFQSYQYLYTKYRDELDRRFTKLDYDQWVLEELERNAKLKAFAHQEGVFVNDKKRVIELLCYKGLSLLNHSKNVEESIIRPYGEQYSCYDKDGEMIRSAEQSVDEALSTNIVIMGNQLLRSAIHTFYSSTRPENSITYATACNVNNFRAERAIVEKLECLTVVSGKVTVSKRYCDSVGDTILYINELTRRDKCKRLF